MTLKVVVDENAGPGTSLWDLFQTTVAKRPVEFLFLKEVHPGIPDVEILDKVLKPEMVLLTEDCVLHMHALQRGCRSFTLDGQGKLTQHRLPGVRISDLPLSVFRELQDDYRHQASSDMSVRLGDGFTERQFKRYRTARRRIRSHFGGAAAICQLSVTIGERLTKQGLLCGYVVNLAGTSGVKGLRGSEGYCRPTEKLQDSACSIIHPLRDLYLLQLEQIPTNLFVIPPKSLDLCRSLLADEIVAAPLHQALAKLLKGLQKLTLQPCVKGPFFDAMQHKLEQLSRGHSNEVTTIDFAQITTKLLRDSVPDFETKDD